MRFTINFAALICLLWLAGCSRTEQPELYNPQQPCLKEQPGSDEDTEGGIGGTGREAEHCQPKDDAN